MKILITGGAGFIGYHLCKLLSMDKNLSIYSIDNLNNYYNIKLKFDRLSDLGFTNFSNNNEMNSLKFFNLKFKKLDLNDLNELEKIFENEKFDVVCNLAAQAGVRYSIENPTAYIESNINGFYNVLECCRKFNVKHLVYASSSSVYGQNSKIPFNVKDDVSKPISLYAATKKSNELMAYVYSHLHGFYTTGLRFFTVYGPWGRPDMAYYLFTDAIYNERPIKVYNYGNMERDFTYIDDIVDGLSKIITNNNLKRDLSKIYNLGNNKTVNLRDFINTIEKKLNKKSIQKSMPLQPGDVLKTWADIDETSNDYGYLPKTNIDDGLESFINWYLNYNNKK